MRSTGAIERMGTGAGLAIVSAILALSCAPAMAQSHIEDVIVETYYISDANDATDTIGGTLATGSWTYRVFLDLDTGCSLRAIYGDSNHVFSIASTALFFNYGDSRGKTFGHLISDGAMDEGTLPLDSWLSMGAATNQKFGVLKGEDTDGSEVGGVNNDGGSAAIPGGLLVNQDPDAGIPLTVQDGLIPVGTGSALPPSFNVQGISPDSVFKDSTLASEFTTFDTRIGCSTPGVKGPTPDNKILIAQLTTTGDLTFCINVEVELTDGTLIKYVSSDSVLLPDETANGLLCYPPVCGCTDPNYLEYDPNAGCDDGSCATAIIFGCLDTLACNFDPNANFHVAELCCYSATDCNGLDVTVLCPDLATDELAGADLFEVFPNPASDLVHIQWKGWSAETIHVTLVDAPGRVVRTVDGSTSGGDLSMDLTDLASGSYALRIDRTAGTTTRIVIVN